MYRCLLLCLVVLTATARAEDADLILHHGKVVTVDKRFSIHQAIAVKGERIVAVGSDDDILKLKGDKTSVIDLGGKTVIPGLIDSHVHPMSACMTEFDHPMPEMESIADVLKYIEGRTKVVPEGEWISMSQVFITRLKEQRYPTRDELDKVAPKHPVMFATGPDAALNSLALEESKIDKDFKVSDGGAGYAEKDPKTGELTGILRNCGRYVKSRGNSVTKQASDLERSERLLGLFRDYNSVGLTAIADRSSSTGSVDTYRKLLDKGRLTVRIAASQNVGTLGNVEAIQANIRKIGDNPLTKPSYWLRIVGIKTFLDGGMLTGSAYMREPWGVSKIYSINDPEYKGLLFIPRERLLAIVQTAVDAGLQFTAHSVGDGAVHTLMDVYEEINKKTPIARTRPCITHSNFMSRETVEKMAKLGVVVDIQPAWLYLDTRTLTAQFGYDRLRYFQPLKSIFAAQGIAGGGSDHMQKIGSFRAVNPYNPFLGMQTTITRKAKWYDGQLHPEEALSREQALRFYTTNNAYIMFLEDQLGALEAGKLADLAVLDKDILTCPAEEIRDIQVLKTYVGGKMVYERK